MIDPADIFSVACMAIKEIGYEQDGVHWNADEIEVLLHAQSADSARGVNLSGVKKERAHEHDILSWYAGREMLELILAPICNTQKSLEDFAKARKTRKGKGEKLSPDAKSQITVRYINGMPVLPTQRANDSLSPADMGRIVKPRVRKSLPAGRMNDETVWHPNPSGKFVIGVGRQYLAQDRRGQIRWVETAWRGRRFRQGLEPPNRPCRRLTPSRTPRASDGEGRLG